MKPIKSLHHYLLLIICIISSFAGFVQAEQISFRKKENRQTNTTEFKYQFKDHSNKTQELNFTYQNPTLFNRFRRFKAFRPNRVQENILVSLKKAAAKVRSKDTNIEFIKRSDRIEIEIQAPTQERQQQLLEGLMKIRDESMAKQTKKAYFNMLESRHGNGGLKPDHVRFAQEARPDVAIMTKAILAANPKLRGRKLTEYILAFVQSIPYSTLESRVHSNGAGFSPPLRVINNNQGDCDSKVTLMASMINAVYPRLKIVIIYINNHALIGVQMTHRKTDKWIKLKDREYILAEPTGPALLPLGTIGEKSEIHIDGQQFDWEIF